MITMNEKVQAMATTSTMGVRVMVPEKSPIPAEVRAEGEGNSNGKFLLKIYSSRLDPGGK